MFIGAGNPQGTPIPIDAAERHVFGLCLLNDWSARDIQVWETQPLGPFLGKNFATTISPWIVTLEALAPFRAPLQRAADDLPAMPYLDSPATRAAGAFDVALTVCVQSVAMRAAGIAPQRIVESNLRHAHWTIAQMLAHHTIGGCNLRAGDLLGTGTLSGPLPAQAGCLLEMTAGGRVPLSLASGETRTFLEDGDEVTLAGRCERAGHVGIGFGTATGSVLPALPYGP